MYDALGVGSGQSRGYLTRDIQGLHQGQGAFGDSFLERPPLQIGHHDESLTFMFPDFLDGTDIGMFQDRKSAGLVDQACVIRAVFCNGYWKEF